jgi:hypothetical protein
MPSIADLRKRFEPLAADSEAVECMKACYSQQVRANHHVPLIVLSSSSRMCCLKWKDRRMTPLIGNLPDIPSIAATPSKYSPPVPTRDWCAGHHWLSSIVHPWPAPPVSTQLYSSDSVVGATSSRGLGDGAKKSRTGSKGDHTHSDAHANAHAHAHAHSCSR